MRLPFSGRNEKLKTTNRILTEAARKGTERIEELERRVAQLEQQLEPGRNEKDKELAVVREAVTNRYLRIQELECTLAKISKK
jgi:malonyl CoA-acyl carrier protein transacylase